MEADGISVAYWFQQAANGLFLACIYGVLAMAYAMLQGISGRIILTFGDIATFGAYGAVSVSLWVLLSGSDGLAVLLPAIVVAALSSAALGWGASLVISRPFSRGRVQSVMIASLGLSIVIQELLRLQSGARDLWLPPLFTETLSIDGGSYSITVGYTHLAAASLIAAIMAGVHVVMRNTRAGRLWRAVSENAALASLCGIDTAAIYRWSFAIAAALAGVSGAIVTTAYGGVNFAMGLMLGFKAMFAAIIGGFGSVQGAAAGGLVLAALEVAWTAAFPMAYRDAVIFGIIVMILILKPEGLFGHVLKRDSAV